MGWKTKLLGDREKVAAYREARRDLDSYQGREETPEYLALNRRVHQTSRRIPWWRR